MFVRKFGVWWHHRRQTKTDLEDIEYRNGSSGNFRGKPRIMIVATAAKRAETCSAVTDVQQHFTCSASEWFCQSLLAIVV